MTRQVVAGLHNLGLAERDHVIRAGIRRAAEGLAIEPLVLEEQDWIIATDRGAQQAVSIQRVGGKTTRNPGV